MADATLSLVADDACRRLLCLTPATSGESGHVTAGPLHCHYSQEGTRCGLVVLGRSAGSRLWGTVSSCLGWVERAWRRRCQLCRGRIFWRGNRLTDLVGTDRGAGLKIVYRALSTPTAVCPGSAKAATCSLFFTSCDSFAVCANFPCCRLKINCVVMKGVNTDELAEFLDFTRNQELDVRFIEWMPFDENRWEDTKFFSYQVRSPLHKLVRSVAVQIVL